MSAITFGLRKMQWSVEGQFEDEYDLEFGVGAQVEIIHWHRIDPALLTSLRYWFGSGVEPQVTPVLYAPGLAVISTVFFPAVEITMGRCAPLAENFRKPGLLLTASVETAMAQWLEGIS
jgi:hypothetical protein